MRRCQPGGIYFRGMSCAAWAAVGPSPPALILVAWPGTLCAKAGLWPRSQLSCPGWVESGRSGAFRGFRGFRGVPARVGGRRGVSGPVTGVSGNAPKFWMFRTSYVVSSACV